LLTGIGSPSRAQIDLFGTSYPTGLPTITSMHIGSSRACHQSADHALRSVAA